MSSLTSPIYWVLSVCLIFSACNMSLFNKKMPDAQVFFQEPQALKLAHAIEKGDVNTIRQSAAKLDINQPHGRGMTFLSWAFAHLNYESAEALVALKANPHIETEGVSPFGWTMDMDEIRWLKLLVNSGANINSKGGDTPLWFSTIYSGNWEHFDYLLSEGVDVNAASKNGRTAIFVLTTFEQYGRVLKLIDKGADIEVVTTGDTSFAYQVQRNPVENDHPEYVNRVKVIKLLEQKGISFPVLSPKEIREQRAKAQ